MNTIKPSGLRTRATLEEWRGTAITIKSDAVGNAHCTAIDGMIC
jgi:hypothetical protein